MLLIYFSNNLKLCTPKPARTQSPKPLAAIACTELVKSPRKHIENFIKPQVVVYKFDVSKEVAITKIRALFEKDQGVFGLMDFKGEFTKENRFEMYCTVYVSSGYGSTLVCDVLEREDEGIEIRTQTIPSGLLYFLAVLSMILGFWFIYNFIVTKNFGHLLSSFILLFLGPIACIGFSNIANAGIRERFGLYVSKVLKA